MAGLPNEGMYVTGAVPPEMRVEGVDVIPPTAVESDMDGVPTQLTRVKFDRPAHIPPPPLPDPRRPEHPVGAEFRAAETLQYDFPLLPGVQCRVIFQGELTADHLEQLSDYLGVACKRLREQQGRPKVEKMEIVAKTPRAKKEKSGAVHKSDS